MLCGHYMTCISSTAVFLTSKTWMKAIQGNKAFSLGYLRNYLLSSSVLATKRWKSRNSKLGNDKAARSPSPGSSTHCTVNLVGPRDYRSNIRKIVYAKLKDESLEEKKFREQQQELNTWHHMFWERQNGTFQKSKKAFLQLQPRDLGSRTNKRFADDMSLFYKDFLDGNHKRHSHYLREWYQRNFQLLWAGLQVSTARFLRKVIPRRCR